MVEDHPLDYQDFEGSSRRAITAREASSSGTGACTITRRPGTAKRARSSSGGVEERGSEVRPRGGKAAGRIRAGEDEKGREVLAPDQEEGSPCDQADILAKNRSVALRQDAGGCRRSRSAGSRQEKLDHIRLREALEDEDLRDAPVTPMPRGRDRCSRP